MISSRASSPRAVDIVYFNFFAFLYKNLTKWHMSKKLSEGATACLFHLPLQAFVAANMKLKARAGNNFLYCEKSNDVTPRTGDESAIQNK